MHTLTPSVWNLRGSVLDNLWSLDRSYQRLKEENQVGTTALRRHPVEGPWLCWKMTDAFGLLCQTTEPTP